MQVYISSAFSHRNFLETKVKDVAVIVEYFQVCTASSARHKCVKIFMYEVIGMWTIWYPPWTHTIQKYNLSSSHLPLNKAFMLRPSRDTDFKRPSSRDLSAEVFKSDEVSEHSWHFYIQRYFIVHSLNAAMCLLLRLNKTCFCKAQNILSLMWH